MTHAKNSREKNKKTILLAEDDPMLADMYKTKFVAEGFHVLLAEDGEAALRLAKEGRPDIALLDIIMPKKEGIEVMSDMKEDPETKDIPVIFLTNLGGRGEDTEAGVALGAEDVITKAEVTPQKIVDRVMSVLEKRT
jgi:DNA-binding response OmpR family regulator